MNNFQALNYAPAQGAQGSSTKRKFEEDASEQCVKAKRLHFLENKPCQLIKEETEEKNQLLHQLMPAITYASPDYKPSPSAIANFANSSMDTVACGMATPPSEQQQQQMQHMESTADVMMVDDDYTDEDESLQTPSYMNCYSSYITTDIGDDLEDGGYTGQLERGWSEMFNEMH